MAERTGFDFVQKTISNSLDKLTNYFSGKPFTGISNDWFTLYTSIYGSLDYFHLVSFPLSGMYNYSHPMYMDGKIDNNTAGYINADLSNDGKESHIVSSDDFDINWSVCPNGDLEYPEWDGWPVVNHSLPDYPVDGITRMFVFLKGMMIRVDSSINTSYNETFYIDATRILVESLRPNDYYDIRVYRYDDVYYDTSLGWVPSGNIYELPRDFVGNDLLIQIGRSSGEDIPNNEPRFFMIYWESPDGYCATSLPTTTTPNDVTSFLTFNQGNTPVSRELFDTYRYDLIDFKNEGNKYIKNYYSTRYQFIDGSSQHVDDVNPLFYRLPAMVGSLDTSYSGDLPSIGNTWGYGYSLDQGANNPDEYLLQGVIICYQPSAGNDTDMKVIAGPIVPHEFQPDVFEDFNWYPPIPEEYILSAKIIIKILKQNHQVSYRPDTFVEYFECVKSYGKDKIDDQLLFSFLYQDLLGHAFLNNYLDTIVSALFIPLIYMTPTTNNKIGGMQYNAVDVLNAENVFPMFNLYWKIPVEHPIIPYVQETPINNVHDYISQQEIYEFGQLEFGESIRNTMSQNVVQQLSTVLGSLYTDDNNLEFGTKCYKNKNVGIPTKLEIHAPITNSCYNYNQIPKLQYDYSFRFKLRSQYMDFIQKDLQLSSSKYYINDSQASLLESLGLNPEEYLWPSKLNNNNDWVRYGRTILIPDLTGGDNATIDMKQFKPRDPTLPLYDDFVANLESEYSDDLNSGDPIRVANAQEAIQDAISDQEYLYGGFDEPDTRTLNNYIYSMDEFLTGVTLYNSLGTTYWNTSIDFWGANPSYFDPDTGIANTRYGFMINDIWYYQNFTETTVAEHRRDFIDTHPESFYILQEQDDDTGIPNNTFALDNTKYALATTFLADFADVYNKVYKVKLKLRLNNIPTAKLVLTINTTNVSHVPLSILQVSDPVDYTYLSGNFEWVEFNFKQPVELADGTRYALVLSSEDPMNIYNGVDSTNTIEWAFASSDIHSYGVTDTVSLLTSEVSIGDSELLVVDGSVFSTSPFYIKIGPEVFIVNSVIGNYLYISGSLANDYDVSTPVYEVTYVASDSESRWVYTKTGDIYSWGLPLYSSYDATYQLYRKIDDVGLVTEVQVTDWSGSDLSVSKSTIDAFYISSSSDNYYIPSSDATSSFYGYLPGLSPFGGFNVANSYDFPAVNTWRAGYTNLVDGFITWSSKELDIPVTFSIFPLAINYLGVVQYLPTEHDMYITAICKKFDGSKKLIHKLLPAGTSSPVILDSDLFTGIDLLWVDKAEFKSDPFYGYGPAESFIIRSI